MFDILNAKLRQQIPGEIPGDDDPASVAHFSCQAAVERSSESSDQSLLGQ